MPLIGQSRYESRYEEGAAVAQSASSRSYIDVARLRRMITQSRGERSTRREIHQCGSSLTTPAQTKRRYVGCWFGSRAGVRCENGSFSRVGLARWRLLLVVQRPEHLLVPRSKVTWEVK